MNVNNKNRWYEFEKIAIIVVVVLVITIGAVVVLVATSGNDSRGGDTNNSELVIQGTSSASEPEGSIEDSQPEGENGLDNSTSNPSAETIKFDTVVVDNSTLSEGELLLVNQDYEFKKNIDDALVNVYTEKIKKGQSFVLSTTSLELRQETIDALCSMLDGFYEDTNISSQSLMLSKAYISVEEQQADYEAESAKVDASKLPYLQAGGESEHHTGLAFHLVVYPSSQGKMGHGAYEWFVDNCWKYGFVLRYPDGQEDRTQAFADGSHFRYVGIPHAAYMHVNQWVLEDYLEYLQDRTSSNSRAQIKDAVGNSYEIYAVKAGESGKTELKVPSADSAVSYTVTGANNGYFVISIKISEN